MKRLKSKRLLAAASVVVAAGVVPLVTATPASADQIDCMNYVRNHGYRVGPKVREACSYRHVGPAAHPLCQGAFSSFTWMPTPHGPPAFVRKGQGR